MSNETLPATAPKQNRLKVAIDYGPIIAFGATFFLVPVLGIAPRSEALIWASGVLAVTSVIAVILGLLLEKRIAWMPLIAAVLGIPFAILTVVFKDPVFVKLKMTIVNVLIGGGLLIALGFGKNPFKSLLGSSLQLKDAAWPRLTVYYALFYLLMGVANEFIWRTQSDEVWVSWKMGSLIGGPILLTIALIPFLMKNMIPPETETPQDS
ncbi:inner membrane-spanning protein YciB [Asticcacaulis tiandongensis]|uniref:inner membrane-spanning protein YciB n=1 Tax=Asticcacaulis tiandongensis TaxID=2565365 RepID=UPI00112DEF60|nr:septation protein IspZ [Asticcacaulis tiandongensis]